MFQLAQVWDAGQIAKNQVKHAEEAGHPYVQPFDVIEKSVLHSMRDCSYGVLEVDDEIVAQCTITPNHCTMAGKFWWVITNVYVTPEFRHKGIATKLMYYVKELMANTPNVLGMLLVTTNPEGLYKDCGFQSTGYHEMVLYNENRN